MDLSMKRDMKKCWSILFVLVIVLCTACGTKEPPIEEPVDYTGTYTDKQATTEVYSSLTLERNEDGTYAVDLSLYRLISMVGTAAETEEGKLRFDCFVPDIQVTGEIAIDGETAELTITASDTGLLESGMVYRFPDGE